MSLLEQIREDMTLPSRPVEARRSPADGLWRAWVRMTYVSAGLMTQAEAEELGYDPPKWVCVSVDKSKAGAIRQARPFALVRE